MLNAKKILASKRPSFAYIIDWNVVMAYIVTRLQLAKPTCRYSFLFGSGKVSGRYENAVQYEESEARW